MQRLTVPALVAAALAMPSLAAAQSNVTIYGVADAYVGIGKHGENDFRGVGSGALSGSRVGFRGTEDLGNGLKAVFVLEQGFSIDNGSEMGSGYQRQALVGLGGSFGTVSLGRQYAPGYFFNYDALSGAAISPQSILSVGAGMTITPNTPARWSNSVAYTGSFSGLTARAIYSTGADYTEGPFGPRPAIETAEKPSEDDAYGLGLEYANGPLKVGGVYQVIKNDYAVAGLDDKQKEWGLGTSYDFGVVSLHASYQSVDNIYGAKDFDADLWQVGLIVPVGAAGNVHLAYGEVEFDQPGRDPEVKSYTLAYTHALSKRTTAYAAFNRTDNESGTNGFGLVTGSAGDLGDDSDIFAVGIRHTF